MPRAGRAGTPSAPNPRISRMAGPFGMSGSSPAARLARSGGDAVVWLVAGGVSAGVGVEGRRRRRQGGVPRRLFEVDRLVARGHQAADGIPVRVGTVGRALERVHSDPSLSVSGSPPPPPIR